MPKVKYIKERLSGNDDEAYVQVRVHVIGEEVVSKEVQYNGVRVRQEDAGKSLEWRGGTSFHSKIPPVSFFLIFVLFFACQ